MTIKKTWTLSTTIAAIFAFSTSAFAAPALYPPAHNGLDRLVNNTAATVIADNADGNTYHVLPPTVGHARIEGMSGSASIGFCREMGDLQGINRTITDRQKLIVRDLDAIEVQRAAKREEQHAAEREMAAFKADPLNNAVTTAEKVLLNLDTDIRKEEKRLAECTTVECREPLLDNLDTLRDARIDASIALNDAIIEAGAGYQTYLAAKNRAEQFKNEMLELDEDFENFQIRLNNLRASFRTTFYSYGKILGGDMPLSFDSGWSGAVARLRADNPGRNFSQIPTASASLAVSLAMPQHATGELIEGAYVMGYTVAGRTVTGDIVEVGAFPENVGANAQLSLLGACYYVHPEYFDGTATAPPLFGLTVNYEFPSSFIASVDGWYNEWATYEYLQTSKTKGWGPWKRHKTSTSVSQDGDSHMEINVRDDANLWTDEQEQAIRDEVQDILTQKILNKFGTVGTDISNPTARTPDSGLGTLAKGVDETCGSINIYCKGVSWALKGIDAILGGGSSAAEFKSRYNVNTSFSMTKSEVQMRPNSTTYVLAR